MSKAVRAPSEHTYFSTTKSLCRECKKQVDAKIHFVENAVYFAKFCPEHGHERVLVSSSVEWYLDALSFLAPSEPPTVEARTVEHGCPFDCGPCQSHQQKVYMPVVPITSACNLDCPICYTVNKNDGAHRLSEESFAQILAHLKQQHAELDIINFTGGEPTLHPQLPRFLQMAREAGIERLTVSTNGLKLVRENYVQELAEVNARIVLSLDTFDPQVDKQLLGANTVRTKLRVLDLLEKYDVTTTLLPAVAAGLNDKDVGPLFDLMLSKDNICSLELHTLTFTGQSGVGFSRSARITIPDLHTLLQTHTQGEIVSRDFVPSPLAHSHCYSICYLLLLDGGGYVSYVRLMGRATLYDLLADSLYIEPGPKVEAALQAAMDRVWSDEERFPQSERILSTLKRLLRETFPSGKPLPLSARRKIAERSTKVIYIHSHMDEENFDVGRVMKCSVGVPETDGSNIPTCSYNVLYRENDTRFADPSMLKRMGRGTGHPLLARGQRSSEEVGRRRLPLVNGVSQ